MISDRIENIMNFRIIPSNDIKGLTIPRDTKFIQEGLWSNEKIKMNTKPKLLNAGSAIDDRGQIIFSNSFNFKNIKRFYVVSNHKSHFVRAWHGHKKENKYLIVVQGTALVCAVRISN